MKYFKEWCDGVIVPWAKVVSLIALIIIVIEWIMYQL